MAARKRPGTRRKKKPKRLKPKPENREYPTKTYLEELRDLGQQWRPQSDSITGH